MSNCRGCGRPIVWGVTAEGKKIPLEAKHAYVDVNSMYPMGQDDFVVTKNSGPEPVWISHFLTCRNANDFSSSKKGKRDVSEELGS